MSDHQKRLSAPQSYPVDRKEGAYVVTPQGPHAADAGLPLTVVLRDVLEYAASRSEVKQLLANGKVEVNGRVQRHDDVTVGFMDVLGFPSIDEYYRVLLAGDGFVLREIDADDAERKLSRVADKTTLKGGVTQLNLADGNNIEVDAEYATQSSLVVSVPDLEIEDELPMAEGNVGYVTGGQHRGAVGEIVLIEDGGGLGATRVVLDVDGEEQETVAEHVYVVGEDEPEVDIDE